MNHNDHVYLLRKGISNPEGTWADLGSGGGAFTLALADLLGPTGQIYSVDKDRHTLSRQEREIRSRFPSTNVTYVDADFTRRLDLPPLDGIVMANSLHFIRVSAILTKGACYMRAASRRHAQTFPFLM